jgi:amino acid transporter
VASVDTGVVSYVAALTHNWFGWNLDPTSHGTILVVVLILLAIQTGLNITGAKVMGRVAQFGVYVEILGTFGIALILLIHGFHHGLGFLFSTQGVEHAATNPLKLDFHGSWLGAALVAVLAPVYIFYGFESAGDISEETKDAGRSVPRAMRLALIWGGIASLVLTAALLLAMPEHNPVGATVNGGGVPFILGGLSTGVQDFLLLLIIFAFFSCGTSVQGAGSRLAFSYARDGALPGSGWVGRVHPRFKTPVNALLAGVAVTVLFTLLVFPSPKHDVHVWFITYPANTNALVALVSFGVSGIYLSFLLTVIGAIVARRRGWVPEGRFTLGRWGMPVAVIAAVYLGLMFINVAFPSGLSSPRAFFNLDWITLTVIAVIALLGALYFVIGRPDRGVARHVHDDLEATGAERLG